MLLADGAVQVEQHQPGFGMRMALAALPGEVGQGLLALLEIGVREGDHRFVQLGVVGHLAHLDGERMCKVAGTAVERQRRQRGQPGTHDDGGRRGGRGCRGRPRRGFFRPGTVERHAIARRGRVANRLA